MDKIKGDIAQGRWFEKLPGDEITFEEMMERYMREHSTPKKASAARDRASLLHLNPFFTGFTLTQITPKVIGDYKVKRREEGASSSTINREVALLKHAFTLAFKVWERVADNPATKVPMEKKPPARDRWLTFEEEEQILSCARHWLKAVVIFAVDTGYRRGEILSLQWKDVRYTSKKKRIGGINKENCLALFWILGESIRREFWILLRWFKRKGKDEIMRRIRKPAFQHTNRWSSSGLPGILFLL